MDEKIKAAMIEGILGAVRDATAKEFERVDAIDDEVKENIIDRMLDRIQTAEMMLALIKRIEELPE